jgi:Zn-dependent protease
VPLRPGHLRPVHSPVSPIFLLLLAITVGGAYLCTFDSDALSRTGVVLLVLGGWAVSLCLHEFGHAAVAYRGGDHSVAEKGYLTLDVRRYAVPGLTFVLPVFILIAGGIPLPGGAVWINNWAIRSRAMRSLVSLAGPLINLVLAVLLVVGLNLVDVSGDLRYGLSYLAEVQVLAFVLNILPIPGLDGWGALEPYLSQENREFGDRAKQWTPWILLLVLIGVPQVARPFFALGQLVFELIGGNPPEADIGHFLFMFWQH